MKNNPLTASFFTADDLRLLAPILERMKVSSDLILSLMRCEDCGTDEDVHLFVTGSLARTTPLCPACHEALKERTRLLREQYDKEHPPLPPKKPVELFSRTSTPMDLQGDLKSASVLLALKDGSIRRIDVRRPLGWGVVPLDATRIEIWIGQATPPISEQASITGEVTL